MEIIKGAVAGQVCAAMPVWMFIADKNTHILYRNAAAARLVGRGRVYRTPIGEVLRCINSEEGCGLSDNCRHCPLRGAVIRVMKGGLVQRKRVTVCVLDKRLKTFRNIPMLLTASPIEIKRKKLCLLTMEDLSDITELRKLLPICVSCKKIKNDKDAWERVENYIRNHLAEVQFSHGLCPECFKKACKDAKPRE